MSEDPGCSVTGIQCGADCRLDCDTVRTCDKCGAVCDMRIAYCECDPAVCPYSPVQ